MAAVEVKCLTKYFDEILAVDDLSFAIQEGEVYGLLGQNGAGKSTTLRILLSLVKPDSGSIRIFGDELSKNRSSILSQTGAIIERPDLYKYLSAYDNLSLFARLSKKKPTSKLIREKLEMVGLSSRSDSKVKTFSQGMKQRLALAVSLIHDPRLLVLDEPVNGLDPQGIADIRNLILNLSRQQGKTVIVSSHLLGEMEQIASSMLILHKGKKIAEGKVSELLDPSQTIVSVQTTDNTKALSGLKNLAYASHVQTAGGSLRFTMNKMEVPSLVQALSETGVGILSIEPRHSLEDYFLSLTQSEAHVGTTAN